MVSVAADRRVSGPQTKVQTERRGVLVKRKDMGVQDMTDISSIVLIVSSEITIFTLHNMHTCCVQIVHWTRKCRLEERGLICTERHVFLILTHTQTCQTNNTRLPPPSCVDQSDSSITRLHFCLPLVPLGFSLAQGVPWFWMKTGCFKFLFCILPLV